MGAHFFTKEQNRIENKEVHLSKMFLSLGISAMDCVGTLAPPLWCGPVRPVQHTGMPSKIPNSGIAL